jgi:hypothetical protein
MRRIASAPESENHAAIHVISKIHKIIQSVTVAASVPPILVGVRRHLETIQGSPGSK